MALKFGLFAIQSDHPKTEGQLKALCAPLGRLDKKIKLAGLQLPLVQLDPL